MGTMPDPVRQLAAPDGLARHVEELYTAHARLVRTVCRSLLRDRNEAEDAMQQTFLSAQRALGNGSVPREPAAWLATIARNECLARVRERMREPLPLEEEPTEFGADAYSAAVSNYEVATLREALADLPLAQRQAILLREFRGLSYDEVARALSVTTAAVESLIFRARRTLQVKLSEALPTFAPLGLLGRVFGSGGGDAVAPVVKVAAIGVGAALLAGGAALGPRGLGLGHGAGKSHHSASAVHGQTALPAASILPSAVWSRHASELADTKSAERESKSGEHASSDSAESSTSESAKPESASSDSTSSDSASSDSTSSGSTSSEKETTTTTPTSGTATPPADSSGVDPVDSADPPEPAEPPEPTGN